MKYFSFPINDVFDLEKTFFCGQCFRWEKIKENLYKGIVNNSKNKTAYYIETCLEKEKKSVLKIKATGGSKKFWENYFDLNRNYSEINKSLIVTGKVMKKAILYSEGIRILNQDFEETVFSFIISANNNIKRIKKNIMDLSRHFGKKLYDKNKFYGYAFPAKEKLYKISLENEKYISCNLGYRDKYLIKTANIFMTENINKIKDNLEMLPGVGEKVKACINLFSLKKFDAFPIDVWIKRALKDFYNFENDNRRKTEDFIKNKFGKNAGLAQQYLFYYVMSNKK
ncbi:MAG: 8-oxoguanine DNA glycosylase [Clostridiales Family XIII bacterium]|nr:8-oxoguanine DNA glycosylase [Clostridiales Family XIII bacterium]